MKTVYQTITLSLKLMLAPVLLLAVVACGKNNDNNNNTNVAAIQHQIVNGQCLNSQANNQVVNMTFCQTTGVGQYQYVNNQCVLISSNQVVDPTYCQNTGYGNGYGNGYGSGYGYGSNNGYYGGTGNGWGTLPYGTGYAGAFGSNYYPSQYGGGAYQGSQNCVGMFYTYNGFTAQLRQCDGYSCRGLFLYSHQTRARVLCL